MEKSEFEVSLRAVKLSGFFPLRERRMSLRGWLWFLVTTLPMTALAVLVVIQIAINVTSFTMWIHTVKTLVYGLQGVFRKVYFTVKKERFEEMIDLIESTSPDDALRTSYMNMRRNSKRTLRKFCNIMFVLNGICISMYVFFPFCAKYIEDPESSPYSLTFLHERPLYVEMWWPTNPHDIPVYYFLCLMQAIAVTSTVGNVASTDALCCSALLAAVERSRWLARTAPRALRPHPSATPHRLPRTFRAWVVHHQNYLRIVEELNSLVGPLLFVTHFLAGTNLLIISYVFIKTSNSLVGLILLFGFLVVIMQQLFSWAYVGQKLRDQSEVLIQATLSAGQVTQGILAPSPPRNALLVIVARYSAAIPDQVSALGFFAISMAFLWQVISLDASYLIFLLQLR